MAIIPPEIQVFVCVGGGGGRSSFWFSDTRTQMAHFSLAGLSEEYHQEVSSRQELE